MEFEEIIGNNWQQFQQQVEESVTRSMKGRVPTPYCITNRMIKFSLSLPLSPGSIVWHICCCSCICLPLKPHCQPVLCPEMRTSVRTLGPYVPSLFFWTNHWQPLGTLFLQLWFCYPGSWRRTEGSWTRSKPDLKLHHLWTCSYKHEHNKLVLEPTMSNNFQLNMFEYERNGRK